MGNRVKHLRRLKRMFPRLAALHSQHKFFREFHAAIQLLRDVEMISRSGSRIAENGRTAVFNMARTYIPYQVCTEVILALKLRQRGWRVRIIYDDGVLRHHDTLTMNDFKPFRTCSRLTGRVSLSWLRQIPTLGDMLVPYSRYLDGNNETIDSGHGKSNFDISPFLEASLVRFFLSAPDDELLRTEPLYDRARKMFEDNCRSSLAVARGVRRRLKPDLVVTSHGIYSTWGVFMQDMMDHGVRCVSYGGNGYTINALDLAIDDIAANKSDSGFFAHFIDQLENEPIQRRKISERVEKLMQSRIGGRAADVARLGVVKNSGTEPVIDRIERLKVGGRQVFGLFPNVMWDNATTFKAWNRVFESPVQWLVETTRYFMRTPDMALVIRVHPAEHFWMPVRKSVIDILRHYLGDEVFDSETVIVIPPDNPLSSYRLFEHLTGGIVYNGTIGPELIYQGVPLIVGAKAAYSDKGFTYDITDHDSYFDSFGRTRRILQAQNSGWERLEVFLYEYFFLHGVPVNFISEKHLFSPNWEGRRDMMWDDKNLDHIVDTLVGDRMFFQEHAEAGSVV